MVNKQGQIVAPPKSQAFSSNTPGASYSQTTNPPLPIVPTIPGVNPTTTPATPGTGPFPFPPQYPLPTPNLAAQFPHGVALPGYAATADTATADDATPAQGTTNGESSESKPADTEGATKDGEGEQKAETTPPPLSGVHPAEATNETTAEPNSSAGAEPIVTDEANTDLPSTAVATVSTDNDAKMEDTEKTVEEIPVEDEKSGEVEL